MRIIKMKSKKQVYSEMDKRIASINDGKSNCIGTLAYTILEKEGAPAIQDSLLPLK